MFESLRKWLGDAVPKEEPTVDLTPALMDAGGVDQALISAWHGPDGVLISNDEVAGFVAQAPDRLFVDHGEGGTRDQVPNAYIDTSAYTAKRYPRELVEYLRGRGRHKVLFGTNYPMITADRALADLEIHDLDEETTELFRTGNARRVFNLDSGS